MPTNRMITLTTDFGNAGSYVGAVKGVLLKINPRIIIVDITHEVSCFNILEGALVLSSYYRYFPKGTIHLVVVDPGVGGKRKGILIQTDNHYFIGPDNGLFSFIFEKEKIRDIFDLTNSKYFLNKPSTTFQVRDIFAPVSAYLSLGVDPKEFGSVTKECYKLKFRKPVYKNDYITGEILYIDRFGNLVSNISSDLIKGEKMIQIKIRKKKLGHLRNYYAEVKEGEVIVLIGSNNLLEIAVNQGSAQKILKAKTGDKITIEKIKK
ncbi:MAG: SAM-dependent chlorinase/fluorinase [candidate division Zixibacteria bacterium]|nr:SAM-dependent chlorinase/fluorinase [candidate division Zixibacteria bacterium]